MEEEAEKLGVSIKPSKKQKIEKVQKKIVEINKKSSEKENKRRQSQIAMDLKSKDEFQLPSVALLKLPAAKDRKENVNEASLQNNAQLLEKVLEDFGIKGKITRVRPGPVVTLYELEPAPGIKSSRIIALADDIARSMSAVSTRIAVIAGQNAIGIELPNETRQTVLLRELIEMDEYRDNKHNLPLVLGKDISGDSVIADLAKMPHLLVAGTTGSGKSVAINTMILSLLYKYTPAECKFIMIDPKMLELSMYEGIPHLLSPVVTEPGKAVVALKWTVREMENRYRLMSTLGVRNVASYNQRIAEAKKNREKLTRTVQTGFDPDTGKPIMEQVPLDITPLPFIVVVVDEMADLMLTAGKDIEGSIQRLAQMARAAGIHIIMATQRPSVDVITGVIKANFPTRISFQVSSRIDSRTILGDQGAEQLLGMGDMLYMMGGGRIVRVHGPFVDEKEVEKVVAFLKKQGSPQYVEDVTKEEEELLLPGFEGGESDDLYQRAVSIVRQEGKASTSFIQRMLKIGYNRAADIMDRMEKEGIVSAANHVGKREVLL
jgi:S-DNA-T family DNA segregation ATPase FtsK/SpoIIIE